ncbi:response regulator transcription factor [Streptomyces sp. NBC_00316]|uniref:response regulator transcription factor n=1 Tax=Streptomyces sp. NBC_00316 TaxID=2975710 RepID=UPI002E2BD8BE|nr:response regulator transcription factor [Streptomyces sp. NBC_00316]
MAVSVVIADDQEMVRSGFRAILDAQPGIEVLADVADGVEALEAVKRLRPDVLLLDIRMPRMDGLEVLERLAASGERESPRVVVVTTFDQDDYVHTALHHGACGFLLKDAGPGLLIEAVRAAAAGDCLISPSLTVRLLSRHARQAVAARAPARALTERETEVARLVAAGATNPEIGEQLFLSLSTVKTHLGSIQDKLSARNRVEIAAWVWESGLADDRS